MSSHSPTPVIPALHRWASFGGFLLFFVLFPAAILHFGSQNLLRVVERQENQTRAGELHRYLQKLELWQNERMFLDTLCRLVLKKLTKPRTPGDTIESISRRLNKRYDQSLHFVQFHESGQPQYIDPSLKGSPTQWAVIQQVLTRVEQFKFDLSFKRLPGEIDLVVKHLLGPLTSIKSLRQSLYPPTPLAQIAVLPHHRWLWFEVKPGAPGLLCLIEGPYFLSGKYWPILLRWLNRRLGNGLRFGFSPAQSLVGEPSRPPGPSSREEAELAVAVSRFRHSLEPELETDRFLVVCHPLKRKGVLYASLPLSRVHETTRRLRQFLSLLLMCLIPTAVVWGYRHFIQRRTRFLSIRWQIAFIFLFATGIPLSGMTFLAHEYLIHRQTDLLNAVFLRSEQYLRQIDSRFSSTVLLAQTSLSNLIATLSADLGQGKAVQTNPELAPGLARSGCSEFYLVAGDEEPVMTMDELLKPKDRIKRGSNADKERRILGSVIAALFRDLTGIAANPRKNLALDEMIKDFMGVEASEEWRNAMIRHLGKVYFFRNLNDRMVIMLSPLTDGLAGPLKYLMLGKWSQRTLQENHLDAAYRLAAADPTSPHLAACSNLDFDLYPRRTPDPLPLQVFARRVHTSAQTIMDSITWRGRVWLIVGVPGQNLSNHILLALTPQSTVEHRLLSLKQRLLAFGLLAMLASIAIALTLSRSILQPLQHLSAATEAIERRQFDFRLPSLGQDEFGHLGLVFNRALESLGELQTAGLVQTSLFPTRTAENNLWEIALAVPPGRRLGGAFAELISLPDQRLLLCFGSVGQTGVRGALALAMFKATLARLAPSFPNLADGVSMLQQAISTFLQESRQHVPVFDAILADPVLEEIHLFRGSPGVVLSGAAPGSDHAEPLMERLSPRDPTETRICLGLGNILLLCSAPLHHRLKKAAGEERGEWSIVLPPAGPGKSLPIRQIQEELEKQMKRLPPTDAETGEFALALIRRRDSHPATLPSPG